jgi:predicted  nucleic acid-binding Zn-ribbon protein
MNDEKGSLGLLLEVQDHDLLLDQLAYRRREFPERRALSEIEARLALAEEKLAELRSVADTMAGRQAAIEEEIAAISKRIVAIEGRLRSGGDYREAQALGAEIDSLARRRREFEDRELELMEQQEPIGQELATAEGLVIELTKERTRITENLRGAEAELDSEIAAVKKGRDELAVALPDELSSVYENLRRRLGGIGAARLTDGACSGCHLRLPNSERARVSRASPDEIVYCEQCGRILVP